MKQIASGELIGMLRGKLTVNGDIQSTGAVWDAQPPRRRDARFGYAASLVDGGPSFDAF
jgi:hypothetical protein